MVNERATLSDVHVTSCTLPYTSCAQHRLFLRTIASDTTQRTKWLGDSSSSLAGFRWLLVVGQRRIEGRSPSSGWL